MATCIECKASFRSNRYDAEFCSRPCRNAFHNRRRDRGAELYDLVMIETLDPKSAERYGLAAKREAYIAEWIEEDRMVGHDRTHKRVHDVITARR